jgi:undecaprenyl-diphosphatase
LTNIELSLFRFINQDAAHPSLDHLMNLISSTQVWLMIISATSLWCFYLQGRKFAKVFFCFFFAAVITDVLNYKVLKEAFARKRPCKELEDVRLAAPSCGGTYGLPSNHAANGAAMLTVWYLIYRRKKITMLLGAVFSAVCYSRVYLGVHYPSDIVVGIFVGGFIGWLVYILAKRLLYYAD